MDKSAYLYSQEASDCCAVDICKADSAQMPFQPCSQLLIQDVRQIHAFALVAPMASACVQMTCYGVKNTIEPQLIY